jgi:5'(3')-deoxyribonucleotidase
MIEKKIVLMDMDGTTFDFDASFNRILKNDYGIEPLPPEKLTSYYLEKLYPSEVMPILDKIWITPGLFGNCLPYPGAIESIEEIAKNNKVIFCSIPRWDNLTCVEDKKMLIRKYFGDNYVKTLKLVNDKTLENGDYLIDDKPIIKGKKIPSWQQVYYNQPWNSEFNGKKRISWNPLEEIYWKKVLPELT